MLALAQTLTSLPLVVLDTLMFGQMIYWLTGLTSQVDHFALYCIVSTLFGATMQAIMGFLPYVVRDELKATISAVLVLIISVLLSGVVATSDIIPSYLQPLFWINPLAWAFRTIANIEFLSSDYDDNPCVVTLNGKTVKIPVRCGDFFLQSRQIGEGWKYVYGGMVVLFVYLIVFWFITAAALSYVRFDPIPAEKKEVGVCLCSLFPMLTEDNRKRTKKWLIRTNTLLPLPLLLRRRFLSLSTT